MLLEKKAASEKIGWKITTLNYMIQKEKAKKDKEEKIKFRNDLKAELEMNKENVRVMDDKLNLIKNKIVFVKGVLKEYYANLMKQGIDTRY